MKKIIALAIAALSLLAVSCNKEFAPETNRLIKKSFTVSAPASSKTELSGLDVFWAEKDTINVIARGTGNQYKFHIVSGEGTATAKFEGTIDEEDEAETEFYAVYPDIRLYTALTPEATTLELKKANADPDQPAVAVENGFDPSLAIMTAVCEEGNFEFRHAVAYLKINIGNDDIKSIKITSGGGARIFGRAVVTIADGQPSAVNGASSGTNFINLAPESGTFVNGSFYLVPITIKPGNNLGKITLEAVDVNDVSAELSHSYSSFIPEAGKVYDIGTPVFDFSTDPKLTLNKTSVQVGASEATGLTLTGAYTIKNCTDADVTVDYDGTVVTAASVADGTVTFSVSENTGDERDGWISLCLAGQSEQVITVSQQKPVTSTGSEYVWNFTADYKSDINVSDESTYKYSEGAVSAVASWTESNVLYLSPNKKAIKNQKKQSSSDKVYYRPLSYGGAAAYLFFNASKTGTLLVTASVGKSVSDTGNCKLGVTIDGTACGSDVDLACYDTAADGLGAVQYTWTVDAPGLVAIKKISGDNSPWIFEVKFIED